MSYNPKNRNEENTIKMVNQILQKMEEKQQMISMKDVEEVYEREVSAYGNSAHVVIPKRHINKKTKIFVFKEKEGGSKKKN